MSQVTVGRRPGPVGRGLCLGLGVLLATAAVAGAEVDLGLLEVSDLRTAASGWTIIDARPRRQWRRAHVPGSHSFSWREHTHTDASGVAYRLHPPARLAAELGALGIDETSAVVVYGDADTSWGGEGWLCWVLAWLGHRGPVRLLAGGLQAWQAAGLPLDRRPPEPAPAATYRWRVRPEVLRTVQELPPGGGAPATLVGTRSPREWRSGHLKGAVHLPWTDLYAGPTRRPLDPAAYRGRLAAAGVDPGAPLVFYCTGGVRSAYAWTVHRLAGGGPAANFEGGMAAWQRRAGP